MAPKKKKPKNGARRGQVTLGPVIEKTVRVPINAATMTKKESQIAQNEIRIRKVKAKIKPDQDQIRLWRGEIQDLAKDIEENTEEQKLKVREEFHWNSNEVVVLRASDRKELERRTMTKEERNRTSDIEDEEPEETASEGKAAAEDEELDEEEPSPEA